MILSPGIHDIPPEAYHADPAPRPSLSSTIAKLIINRSPLHAWTASPKLNPDWQPTESKTFDIGRAAHRAVLGKGGDYVEIPAGILASNGAASTKEAKAFIDEARPSGQTPLKAAEVAQIKLIAASVQAKLQSMGLPAFNPVRSELTALAELDGIWCRAMVDNAPAGGRHLYDLKTCEDASPEAVVKSIVNYRYDIQAAHYLDVWQAATGERRKFRFVFVEKSAPYEVAVVELYEKPGDEADWFDHARADAADARRIWGQCLRSGIWPGYPGRIAIVGAPSWHTSRQEAKAANREAMKPSGETLKQAADWQSPAGVQS